jgi:predicted RNase H-like nuclease
MYYVGIDLAWGRRSPTGVAVLDRGGALEHVGVAGDDADVLSQIAPYVEGDCIVAVDAPLVVTNPTGNRRCEAELNRDFRRWEAGTHPANTGLAWFSDGGRGARLCTALDLDLDPHSPSTRKAIEVFPHAASVVLFGLDKTLKYKHKTGRDFAGLRSELLRFIGFMEGLSDLDLSGQSGWSDLRNSVQNSTRKAQLRRAEDPVDAVLCAYIGRFATEYPEKVRVYGDPATGCIVTPAVLS